MLRISNAAVAVSVVCGFAGAAVALEESTRPAAKAGAEAADKLVPLNKSATVLLDKTGKRVLVKAKVVLREGLLEMLLCKTHTKEHESILAFEGQAYLIHAGLLAIGARPGTPVSYLDGETKPPTGQRVDVFLQWKDEKGKLHREPAQKWIRHATHRYYVEKLQSPPAGFKLPEDSELRYDARHKELIWYGPMTEKQRDEFLGYSADEEYQAAVKKMFQQGQSRPMKAHWVFAGSSYLVETDEDGRQVRHYQAEGGDVICVANFPSALLDVSIESTATGETNLLFEAWTERIPPLETEVTLELVPAVEKGEPATESKEGAR